jgi:hypothetical protein
MTQQPDGSWAIKDVNNADVFVKAVDTLVKADGEFILRRDLDGYRLTKQEFSALPKLKEAAAKLDAAGGWSEGQRLTLTPTRPSP